MVKVDIAQSQLQKSTSKVYEIAKRKEPKITSAVKSAALKSGSKLYGLEHRLKTPDSINRKIDKAIKEDGLNLQEAAKDIKDAVRYTTISDEKRFVQNYNNFKSEMNKSGYDEVRCKNNFQLYAEGKAKHKSVQSVFKDQDGYLFEVQFQTPSSQQAKDLKIPIYEERRKVGISKARAKELERQMDELAKAVNDPVGIESIKTYNKLEHAQK